MAAGRCGFALVRSQGPGGSNHGRSGSDGLVSAPHHTPGGSRPANLGYSSAQRYRAGRYGIPARAVDCARSLATVGFLLAAVGIHGLLAFAVSSRTQEIGVRIALGARAGDIVYLTVSEGLKLAVMGTLVGGALAYGAGRLLESLLAGVKPWDPGTFAAAAVLSAAMTVAGSLAPAIRAVRVDPATAMRAE